MRTTATPSFSAPPPTTSESPGNLHEAAGHQLLLARGAPEGRARFAGTHGDWHRPGIELGDLIVSLADKVWKAKRVPDLEQLMELDDEIDRIAAHADARLAYQNQFSVGMRAPENSPDIRS
ncbi:hypothetical protein ACQP2X_30630 [Actinoplanes sp. CA-131856]